MTDIVCWELIFVIIFQFVKQQNVEKRGNMVLSTALLAICGYAMMMRKLRTVPPFVTAHTFCTSQDIQIQKENWGNHAFFRDN